MRGRTKVTVLKKQQKASNIEMEVKMFSGKGKKDKEQKFTS